MIFVQTMSNMALVRCLFLLMFRHDVDFLHVDVTLFQRSSTYIMSTKEGMPTLMKRKPVARPRFDSISIFLCSELLGGWSANCRGRSPRKLGSHSVLQAACSASDRRHQGERPVRIKTEFPL